jgi:hypothetical protein
MFIEHMLSIRVLLSRGIYFIIIMKMFAFIMWRFLDLYCEETVKEFVC